MHTEAKKRGYPIKPSNGSAVNCQKNSGLRTIQTCIFVGLACVYAISLALTVYSPASRGTQNVLLIASSFALCVYSFIELLIDRHPYSLNKMHWYFILLFMGIVPIVQHMSNYYPWGYVYSNTTATTASFIVVTWCICYSIAFRLFSRRIKQKEQIIRGSRRGFLRSNSTTSEMYVLATGITIVVLKLILSRGTISFGGGVLPSSYANGNVLISVLDKGLSSVPILGISVLLMKRHQGVNVSWSSILILIICSVITASPTAIPRYLLGALTFGLLIHAFPTLSRGRQFDGIVIIALFVAFPILTGWGRGADVGSFTEYLSDEISSFTLTSGLNWVDFDAFSILCRVVDYVKAYGTTDGIQMMTAILFFIPKAIWHDKGYMTSELLVDSQTPGAFSNLSSPLMAEAYIDYSWIGVIVVGLMVGLLLALLDFSYWSLKRSRVSLIGLLYPFLLGFVIYIMRGSLLYGIMWLIGFAWPSVLFIRGSEGEGEER